MFSIKKKINYVVDTGLQKYNFFPSSRLVDNFLNYSTACVYPVEVTMVFRLHFNNKIDPIFRFYKYKYKKKLDLGNSLGHPKLSRDLQIIDWRKK